ncbi:Protein tyrosine kinase [Musa troglodytarum]|uniref:Protein tyrosine kinase n=1 Tax=Musa troglodytarum TaxID=320322 RepID=A0A9E7JKE4_9LILI|nr:Protein tyrosine kinase [Musa troglodytarum]
MCKTRGDVDAASPRPNPTSSPSASAASDAVRPSYSFVPVASSTSTGTDRHARRLLYDSDFDSSAASVAANLRLSLSQDSHPFRLYSFTEILSATDRFLAPPLSPSADSWRCRLRGGDAVVFRRPFLGNPAVLPSRIAALCRSHHGSVVELLGASLADDHIYFVYSYVAGASLFRCLRNPQNPSFTPLASWFSRVQVAADVAQGLEYIHHHSETVHNWVKSSGIIITEPGLRAKICHFGAAELAAELARSRSRGKKIEWTRGYMAPEEEGRRGRIRRWVDRRLGDSFPVEGAEEGMRVALRCVAEEAAERPQMVWVAGKLSKLLIQATAWDDRLKTTPTRYLTSVGPR